MPTAAVQEKLTGLALAAAVLLGAASPAQAVLVTGRFDPSFSGDFAGYGYTGTATFNISQACLDLSLPPGGAFVYQVYNCGGAPSAMSFVGATVSIYTTSDPSDILGTLNFAGDPANQTSVLGMFVDNGQVIGIQTTPIGPVTSNGLLGGADPSLYLQFGSTDPGDVDADEATEVPTGPDPGDGDNDLDDWAASTFAVTTMFTGPTYGGEGPGPCGTNSDGELDTSAGACTAGSSALTTSFVTGVPEPGSLALGLLALASAGWSLRRRRRE